MQVNNEQLAILADRFERMDKSHQAMCESFDAMRISFAKFESTPIDVAALKVTVAEQSKLLDRHSFIIKLCGMALMLCVGLIGWGWREGKELYRIDNSADRRLLMIEYKLNIPPTQIEGDKIK